MNDFFSSPRYIIHQEVRTTREGQGDHDFYIADKRTRILYHTETQDVNEDHRLYKEWADSRIVDRFRSHQMQVKKYAAKYGCSRIVNLMIRPTLTFASKAVRKFFQKAVKDYKINMVLTGKQLLGETVTLPQLGAKPCLKLTAAS